MYFTDFSHMKGVTPSWNLTCDTVWYDVLWCQFCQWFKCKSWSPGNLCSLRSPYHL